MEIIPGLYRLARLWGVNAYLWRPTGNAPGDWGPLLFDCGYPWSGRDLAASLAALDCRPAEIVTIAITHADIDHVGGLAHIRPVGRVAAAGEADIAAHAAEASRMEDDRWRTLPGLGRSLDPVILASVLLYRLWPPRPTRVTRVLHDGEELGGGWIAVHTPGHTPGHMAFFHPRTGALIAGDALGSVRNGRLRLPKRSYAEDWDAALASVRKLSLLQPEVICFGHGLELYDAAAMLHRLIEAV